MILLGIIGGLGILTFGIMSIEAEKVQAAQINTNLSFSDIVQKAKQEGIVKSTGMEADWANFQGVFQGIKDTYGLNYTTNGMSSATVISNFQSNEANAEYDIGGVGISFAVKAGEEGLTLPYKTQYWDSIPNWAKGKNGNWVGDYTGTVAIIVDKNNVKNAPKTWEDILKGNYKVSIGDVSTANSAQMAFLSANEGMGGSLSNIKPGLNFFKTLAKEGRLSSVEPTLANLEKGEIDVAFIWDFNALDYAYKIDRNEFDIIILPKSITTAYASIINKYSKDPYAAMVAENYMLSNKGQIDFAKGYARPIRKDIKIPESIENKLLPESDYKDTVTLGNSKAWNKTASKLPQLWQKDVIAYDN